MRDLSACESITRKKNVQAGSEASVAGADDRVEEPMSIGRDEMAATAAYNAALNGGPSALQHARDAVKTWPENINYRLALARSLLNAVARGAGDDREVNSGTEAETISTTSTRSLRQRAFPTNACHIVKQRFQLLGERCACFAGDLEAINHHKVERALSQK